MNCAGLAVPEPYPLCLENGFTLEPLGDQAILIRHEDCEAIAGVARTLREWRASWMGERVPSYRAIAVFVNDDAIELDKAMEDLTHPLRQTSLGQAPPGKRWLVPCCYTLGPDLESASAALKLKPRELIDLHSGSDYTVYAVGFQPGFPYAGWLPEKLEGLPRRAEPRIRVEPGSVGITGKQTGIYPAASPGGWNLIGRTPCPLADLEQGWFAFAPGDRIRFFEITENDWPTLLGQRPREG
jgi:KipI family sensor histidine kinase inhibitor